MVAAALGESSDRIPAITTIQAGFRAYLFAKKMAQISDARASLESGIEIREDEINKVVSLWNRESQEMEILNFFGTVFTVPNSKFVFKIDRKGNDRFRNAILIQRACKDHNLNLLMIPRAKQVEHPPFTRKFDLFRKTLDDFNDCQLIVEEFIPNLDSDILYRNKLKELCGEQLKQLIQLISLTGLRDLGTVNWPLRCSSNGELKICIVDTEFCDPSDTGRGLGDLFSCAWHREDLEFIKNEGEKLGICNQTAQKEYLKRVDFFNKNGIN